MQRGWTDAEMLRVLELRSAGLNRSEIARRMGRGRNSVVGVLLRIDRDFAESEAGRPSDRARGTARAKAKPGAMREIVDEEAVRVGVSPSVLLGRRLLRNLFPARRRAMRRCRDELGKSYGEIARFFGRDTSTVNEAVCSARGARDDE